MLLWSERDHVREAVGRAFRRLGGRLLPRIPAPGDAGPAPGLAVLDLGGSPIGAAEAVRRLPAGAELIALVDAGSAERLIQALLEGCADYLFFPLNPDEVRLVWTRRRGGGPPAVPALDRPGEGRFRLELPSDARQVLPAARRLSEACAAASGIEPAAAFRLRVALGEAVSNAILYGNGEDPGRRVRLEGRVEPGRVRVTVADEGEGFDPRSVPDPTRGDRIGRPSGRGLFLMRRLVDGMWHNERGNEVTLVVGSGRETGPPVPGPGAGR